MNNSNEPVVTGCCDVEASAKGRHFKFVDNLTEIPENQLLERALHDGRLVFEHSKVREKCDYPQCHKVDKHHCMLCFGKYFEYRKYEAHFIKTHYDHQEIAFNWCSIRTIIVNLWRVVVIIIVHTVRYVQGQVVFSLILLKSI